MLPAQCIKLLQQQGAQLLRLGVLLLLLMAVPRVGLICAAIFSLML
jgi:hypothetical protein